MYICLTFRVAQEICIQLRNATSILVCKFEAFSDWHDFRDQISWQNNWAGDKLLVCWVVDWTFHSSGHFISSGSFWISPYCCENVSIAFDFFNSLQRLVQLRLGQSPEVVTRETGSGHQTQDFFSLVFKKRSSKILVKLKCLVEESQLVDISNNINVVCLPLWH